MAFPVTCPACGKAFQLATDIYERKVAGKIVSIKCKQCQSGIRVDATQPGELKIIGATPAGGGDLSVGPKPPEAKPAAPAASADKPQAAPIRMRQPTLIGMVNPLAGAIKSPTAAAPARPPAASTPALWAVDAGGEGDDRELNEDEIQRELRAGKLTAQTLAWREGMGEWLEIEKIPELKGYLALARREEPKTVPPPGRAKEQSAGFQDEPDAEATMVYDRSAPNAALERFAGIDQESTARVELPPRQAPEKEVTARVMLAETARMAEPPPPAPPLPAAGRPAPFAKTTPLADAPPPPPPLPPGRSSPLAAAAPAARPAPQPAAARPAPQVAEPVAARPAPPPAVRPAPPPAQPVAEAPPPPPPPALPAQAPPAPAFPSPPAQAPMLAAVPWGDALPSAKPAVPGLPTAPYGPDPFAVAATTDLDFPNPKSKRPLVIALAVGAVIVIGIVIAVATSGSPPVANVAAPPPAPTTTTTTESPKAEPTATSEPTPDDSRGLNAPATQPQSPSGNFSDLFSKGAKSKGSGPGKGFNEAEAREALSGLLKAAAACKEPGGRTGQASATITFEASGNVSGVTVGAPFAGTSTGTCIITAFKRAKVAPFSGLPGTVSQTISLR